MRLQPPELEPKVDGETRREAGARLERNRRIRRDWEAWISEPCGDCGLTRSNVVHNVDVEDQLEGPDYYADMADRLHTFRPAK